MEYALLACSLSAGIAKNLLSKSANKNASAFGDLMNINLLIALFGIVVFIFGNTFRIDGSPLLFLLLALFYGLMTIGSQTFFMFAVQSGEVSVCSIIYSANFIIPTVFAVLAYHDPISVCKAIGIGMICAAIILVSQPGSNRRTVKSIVFALLAMLCSAGVGIIQKVFAHEFGNGQSTTFLFYAFLFMFVVAFILKAVTLRAPALKAEGHLKQNILAKILLAFCVVLANKLNMYLSAALPATILFPILNGGTVVFSAICSIILFKDRVTVRKLIALPVTVAAIVLFAF